MTLSPLFPRLAPLELALASAPLADDAKMADKLDLSQSDYKEVIKGMKEGFSGTPV